MIIDAMELLSNDNDITEEQRAMLNTEIEKIRVMVRLMHNLMDKTSFSMIYGEAKASLELLCNVCDLLVNPKEEDLSDELFASAREEFIRSLSI